MCIAERVPSIHLPEKNRQFFGGNQELGSIDPHFKKKSAKRIFSFLEKIRSNLDEKGKRAENSAKKR